MGLQLDKIFYNHRGWDEENEKQINNADMSIVVGFV